MFNIELARDELRSRPVKRRRPEALQMMSNYWKANKQNLPKDMARHRDTIISKLMSGSSAEESFQV